MDVNLFLKELKNYEKTRDSHHFQSYDLVSFRILVHEFLEENPNRRFRISVIGTNGKGSVSEFLSHILSKEGDVGLYTSPHLFDFTERIQMNHTPIHREWIERWLLSLSDHQIQKLRSASYFEFLTLVAMVYFSKSHSKYEIFEAGLGGRLDATRESNPDFVVLTRVDLDHMEILGNTREKILGEKLGIVTNATKIVFYMRQEGVDSPKIQSILKDRYGFSPQILEFPDKIEQYPNYLSYNFQFSKFILKTLVVDKYIDFYFNTVIQEIELTQRPPGRLEIIRESPPIIYDVAHNPAAVLVFLDSIFKIYGNIQWNVILGSMPDKDIQSILTLFLEKDSISMIYQVTSPPFTNETISHPKIIPIEGLDVSKKIKIEAPFLLLGSFRLRELCK